MGKVTDRAPNDLRPEEAVLVRDAHWMRNVTAMRRGWEFDGSVADVAGHLVGVWRATFKLANVTRTLTSDANGNIWIHNQSAAGTKVWSNPYYESTVWLPRAMYRDELIFCAQDGHQPLLRYSGSALSASYSSVNNVNNYIGGTASASPDGPSVFRLGANAWPSGFGIGSYIYIEPGDGPDPGWPMISYKAVAVTGSTRATLDGVRSNKSNDLTIPQVMIVSGVGVTYQAVGVYGVGTVQSSGGAYATVTGTGTEWLGGSWGDVYSQSTIVRSDALLNNNSSAGLWEHVGISSVSSATSLVATISAVNQARYQITRRCPFKDVAAHRGSLFGAGVAQYQSRVYCGPPNWNLSFPPGAVEPFDPSALPRSASSDFFLMDFIDVPSPNDSDPIVALLSSDGPLLVLKRRSVHAIHGSYPSFSQSMLFGDGCVDIRSAISVSEGAFWCGERGIYRYFAGAVDDLTEHDSRGGLIKNEWQSLVKEGITYCSAGMGPGHHLVISVKTASTSRTYVYSLVNSAWSEMTNVLARYLHTCRVSGEVEALFAVDYSRVGRVIDLAPCFTSTKVTDRVAQTLAAADPTDDDGTGPSFAYHSGQNLAGTVERETRMLDMSVVTNIYDSATPSTTLTVQTVHSGGLRQGSGGSERIKSLSSITADTADIIDRYERRVGASGRTHQVKLESGAIDADNKKLELHELYFTWRDLKDRT
jgi:hypothetical protein